MGLCSNPDKKKLPRKRKTSYSTGRNAGHRYRGKPKMATAVVNWTINQPEDTVSVPVPGTLIEVSNETNEMWDTHGYIQNWYNPCVKEHFRQGDTSVKPIADTDGPVITFNNSYSLRSTIRATLPFLDNAQLDELALRSNDALSSVVAQNVSLANFIIELIEMCTGNVKSIKRFSSVYEKAIAAYRRELARLLKAGHKQAAAHWLAWNFAIKPALKDLRSILCSVSQAYAKMRWLRNNNHKIIYLDYNRRDIADIIDYDPGEYLSGQFLTTILKAEPNTGSYPNGAFYYQVRYTNLICVYHARSKIFLDIPDEYLRGMKGMGTLWEAMMGLHNPVGIIWEAIPFSWLIDYFLSYRARLFQHMFDYNPYDEGVTVLGFGHSFTIKANGDARIHNVSRNVTHQTLGGFQYDLYSRQVGLPYPEETTLFRVPDSWYKASIIGAIGIGILPGRRQH